MGFSVMQCEILCRRFGVSVSRSGASIIMKVWEGRFCKNLEEDMSKFYDSVRWVKPKSSRSDSAETFILGRNFKGPVNQPS